MIPERIYVEGFLCYREGQEASFDGCSVWMIAGPNGSGKSALFDAVTYALYGCHRAGRQNARGLIHQASDALIVEFDFQIDRQLFRARRTLGRNGRTTRQLLKLAQADSDMGGLQWQEVEGTYSEQGFSRWVHDNVGLTYETFTSSVLLLQGKSDNLLHLAPGRRRELLTQLVGLEPFERLHEAAKQACAQARGALSKLRQQLRTIPKVSKRHLASARQAVETASKGYREAAARVERLQTAALQTDQSRELQQRLAEIEEHYSQASKLLEQREQTIVQHERWQMLETHLPKLLELTRHQKALRQCRHELDRLEDERQKLHAAWAELDEALAADAVALQEVERDVELAIARSRQLSESRAVLTLALSVLQRLCTARDRLCRAQAEAESAHDQLERARAAQQQAANRRPSAQDSELAQEKLRGAAEQLARCETHLQEVSEQCARFRQISGRETCPYCRQALPEGYRVREKARVEEQYAEAKRLCNTAQKDLRLAQDEVNALRKRQAAAERDLERLSPQIAELQATCRTAQRLQEHSVRECEDAARELSSKLGSDWSGELGGDFAKQLATVQAQYEQCVLELKEVDDKILCQQQMIRRLRNRRHQHQQAQQPLQMKMNALAQRAADASGRCTQHEQTVQALQNTLPEPWRSWPDTVCAENAQQLREELDMLRRSDVANRFQMLQTAATEADKLAWQRDLLKQHAGPLAPEARCAPDVLQSHLEEAQSQCQRCEQTLQEASSEATRLSESAERHKQLADQLKQAERQLHLWNRLVPLLGADFLQRHLLGNAERAIVEYANAVLDRLGGGQLYLELSADRGGYRALELVARTATSGDQLQDVAFLSGSQKFRVAVALSLAVGQYASRHGRPVQAVIIDEGFGCLDALNRQVMIQELQNLRQHLRRILLVSHQDEFASAFTDGYHCRLVGTSTQLTRFHR